MATPGDSSEVQAKFVTSSSRYVVTDSPITVPTKLRRYGLSEIVNHLLGRTEKLIPFDFLINGEFLRTSIQKYLDERSLSTEHMLTIEYVESSLPPSQLSGYQHDEWISSVKGSQQGHILTGSYDSAVRVWDESHNCLLTMKGHSRPVKSLSWLKTGGELDELVSGSDDATIRLWKINPKSKQYESVCEFKGHEGTVTSVSSNPSGTRFVSGSWDGTLKIWNPKHLEELQAAEAEDADSGKEGKKKRKRGDESKVVKHSLVTMTDHTDSIQGVEWSQHEDTMIVSGGNDSFVRVWDSRTAVNTLNLNCEKPLNGLSISPLSGLIASGHTDNTVRVWDPRVQDGVVVKMTLSSHTGWVTATAWSPASSITIVSASHDQTLKVWDIRSSTPLHTIAAHEGKVLAVDWVKEYILSGSTDNKMKIFKVNDQK